MWLENAVHDARFAYRIARRNPGFTALAVLTLALGIGATTAIFSVVKAVLLNHLPYRDPDRVVALSEVDPAGPTQGRVGEWTGKEWRRRAESFESISLWGDAQRTLRENGEAYVLRGMRVNYDFFETLGVKMMLGRSIHADEDQWPRANVVILTHELWLHQFGGDPQIIGRVLDLSYEKYRVIGVLPANFYPLRMSNPAEKPAIFMPLGYDARAAITCQWCFGGEAIGRLKPGVSVERAGAELNAVMRQMTRENASYYDRGISVHVEPLRDHLVGSIRTALWVVMCAVAFVLLIVCANIANLMLARATGRSKEIAIRAALGGSRWRLAGQLLIESLLLALVGGAVGVLLGWQGVASLVAVAPKELPRFDEVHMDAGILLFALGISVATGLLFGILPALRASRLHSVAPRIHSRLRNVLVVSEIAMAFVLAVGTGLLAKSFLKLTSVDGGFDPHHILTMTPTLNGLRYETDAATLGFYRQVLEKVRAIPGVLGAAMISNVPLSHIEPAKLRIEGAPSITDADEPTVDMFWSSPDYFRVLKIPLERGRFFTNRDSVSDPPAAIVTESLAKLRFPGSQAIGRRIRLGSQRDPGPWFTIVGIVGDIRNAGLDQPADEAVYVPLASGLDHYTRLVVRTVGDPMSFENAVRAAIRAVDPLQPVFHVQPLDDYVASSLAYRSFTLMLIGLFGTLSVILAAIGIYGVISYTAGLRTREVGIRMALGAERGSVLRLILRDVLILLACGLTAGFLAALMLTRFLAHLLFEVQRTDLATSASVALVLSCAALLAGYFPALRAARIDPSQALRSE